MAGEAELPGRWLPPEAWQMIVKRYDIIASHARGKRLLEVGCGAGLGLSYLLSAGVAEIVAIDRSPENIELARRLSGGRVNLRVMDAHQLQFPDGRFDVVSCMQVIQYLDAPQFIAAAARVLAPVGLLIVEMPNIRRRDGFRTSAGGRSYYTASEMAALFSAAGLTPSVYGAFGVPADATRPSRKFLKRCKRKVVDGVLAIPGGERVKDAIVARLLTRVCVHEVAEEDVALLTERAEMRRLSDDDEVDQYQLIYVTGRKIEQLSELAADGGVGS